MKLRDIASDILPDTANQVLIAIKDSIWSKEKFVCKRIEELTNVAWKSAIQSCLHSVKGEEVLHGLSRIGLTVQIMSIDVEMVRKLDGGSHHIAKSGDRHVSVQHTELVIGSINDEERVAGRTTGGGSGSEGIKRVVGGDDDSSIEWRWVDTLVRGKGAHFFVSRNTETVVKLQPGGHIVSELDHTTNPRFPWVDLQAILSRSKCVVRSSKIRWRGIYPIESRIRLKGVPSNVVNEQGSCAGKIAVIRVSEAQPREVLIGKCTVLCENRTLIIEVEGRN